MHNAEHTLLHFASVLGTEDDHLHALEVDLHRRRRRHALSETVGGELTGIVNDEVGLSKVGEFLLRGTDKHVML